MTPKFDLMKILRKWIKEDKVKLEGAIVAFKHSDGNVGMTTICPDVGIALRFVEGSKVQEKVLEIQREELAKKNIMSIFSSSKEENRGKGPSMIG